MRKRSDQSPAVPGAPLARNARPPRGARRLLTWLLGPLQAEPVEQGLEELFQIRLENDGRASARAWYWRQVFGFLWRWRALDGEPDSPGGPAPERPRRRGAAIIAWMEDAKHAARSLRRQPGFASLAIATLAIGIAANATVFSVLDGALFRPMQIPHAERLMSVHVHSHRDDWTHNPSFEQFRSWRDASLSSADAVMAYPNARWMAVDGIESTVSEAIVQTVSPQFFPVVAGRAAMGRTLTAADHEPGATAVVVLSHELWQRSLRADPKVLGKVVRLNGAPHTVVGVLAAGFRLEPGADRIYRALPTAGPGAPEADDLLSVFVRMREGATAAQLAAELQSVLPRDPRQPPDDVILDSMRDDLYGWAAGRFAPFMGVVVCVLLLVAANLANLVLVRTTNRHGELALRAALGCGRGRLAAQAVMEVAIITSAAAALGTLLTWWGITTLVRMNPMQVAQTAPTLDARVLGFVAAVALLAGSIAALAPALAAAMGELAGGLRHMARRGSDAGRMRLVRRALAVIQIACSLLLLTGAGLLTKTIVRMQQYDPGFEIDNLVSVWLTMPEGRDSGEAERAVVVQQLLDGMRAVPGVVAASATASASSTGAGWLSIRLTATEGGITLQGHDERLSAQAVIRGDSSSYVAQDYFRALGVPIVRGRSFVDADFDEATASVAVINEEAASRWWTETGGQALGKRFKFGPPSSPNPWITVVGVVKTYRSQMVTEFAAAPAARVYLLLSRAAVADWPDYYVRTATAPGALVGSLKAAVEEVDQEILFREAWSLEDDRNEQLAYYAVNAKILLAFSAFGALIAAMGIYGVVVYGVARRTREIGIRKALGAQTVHVFRTVTRESVVLAAIGLAAGLALSAALTRGLESMLYGISPLDPAVFVLVSVLLALIVGLATYLPARRAARIDPVVALSQE